MITLDIHRGQIVTELMRRFDSGETGTFILPGNYRITINGQARAVFYRQALEVQSYNAGQI